MLLNGKVALVTGGGRGIGRETCLLLASHGAHIAVCSLFEEECQEVVDVINKQYKVRAIAVPCDVTNEAQVKKACAFVKEELGPVDTKMTDDLGPDLDKTGWLQPIDMANVIVNIALPHSKAITAASIEAFGTGMPVGLTK